MRIGINDCRQHGNTREIGRKVRPIVLSMEFGIGRNELRYTTTSIPLSQCIRSYMREQTE
jgi:hypothetical protein